MLSDDDIVALARTEIERALGYDADQLATVREGALDYYHGKMRAAPEGRSNIVSFDVADTVHSLLSQLQEQFATASVVFEPKSEEDEQQADLESNMCRYQLDRNNGQRVLAEAAHEGLLSGNAWIRVDVEEETDVVNEDYPQLDDMQLYQVSQPNAPDQAVTVTETDEGYRVRRETTLRSLVIEAKPADVMLYSTEEGMGNLKDLRLVSERKLLRDSELKELGLSDDQIGAIPRMEDDYWPAVRARSGRYQDYTDHEAAQNANTLHECFDSYIKLDMQENGTTELWNVLHGGSVVISKEPVSCVPYATGSPVPLPHRVAGQGMFQLMGQVQDAKTEILRNYVDNLNVMNSSRIACDEATTNIEDLTNGRINGIIRTRGMPANSIMQMPAADVGGVALQGLAALDAVRSQRGGAAVELSEADRQIMASSATAASGVMQQTERMAGWYTQNMIDTLLCDTYKLIHKKLRLDYAQPLMGKLNGKWVESNPAEWQEREHLELTAGPTSTQRTQKRMALETLIQQQMTMLMQGGEGVIVDKSKVHGAMSDWIKMTQIGDPYEYLVDPDSEEAQAAQQQLAQQQQMQAEQAKQERAQLLAIEQAKVAQDKYKVDKEIEYKYYDTNVDAGLKEAEMTVDAVTEQEKLNSAERQADKLQSSPGDGQASAA